MVLKGKLTQDEYDALNDVIKAEYAKGEDDHYYPDVESVDGWGFDNYETLRSTSKKEREARQKWERKHRELEQRVDSLGDLTPEDVEKYKGEIDALKAKIEEMQGWEPDDKVRAKIQSIEMAAKENFESAKKEWEDRESGYTSEIERMMITSQASKELGKLGVLPEFADLILEKVAKDCKVVRGEDGRFRPVVLDVDGEPRRTKKPGSTDEMSLEEYLGTYTKAIPGAFKGVGSAGGGAGGTGGPQRGTEARDYRVDDKLSPAERLRRLREQQANASAG